MRNKKIQEVTIRSISQLHHLMGSEKPAHPLISVIRQNDHPSMLIDHPIRFTTNFYVVMMKRNLTSKIRYGQQYYDFDEGIMAMMAPGQTFTVDSGHDDATGWLMVFHPDLIRSYPLGRTIKTYGFFNYEVHEALHLSKKEESTVERILKNIREEYHSSIDRFSQDVMVSHLDLLFNYINRFYNRQFITRRTANNDLLAKLDKVLSQFIDSDDLREKGLPTVQYAAEQLHISSNYLSDMLRAHTGKTTQQHIHDKLIDRAKDILTTTKLSVSEIAYQLGFEHSQSFSRLFKSKTNLTPLAFRASFN